MSEYNEGDLIEAVKGETAIRGRIRPEPRGRYFWVGDSGRTTDSFTDAHFTLTVIEKAAPKLPTESGFYRVSGSNAAHGGTVRRTDDGRWWWIGNDFATLPSEQTAEETAVMMPLTRLEPVPETADKIRAQLFQELEKNDWETTQTTILAVFESFGATP